MSRNRARLVVHTTKGDRIRLRDRFAAELSQRPRLTWRRFLRELFRNILEQRP